uniref:Ribosomal RNA-processing protein 43 n=1 Tax=Palpitomonas bilix TaxID=652834 RepID=A0A7S3CYE7_9EUKA|mmetsp:Transcript_12148/g.32734  ORF Transcript_12148/g.32734 Transcript_12148/m.32734 type:complete len:301 (+) Transcript_12148:97-999(+)
MDAAALRAVFPREYLHQFYTNSRRPDGRELTACRNLSVSFDNISHAFGSCMVRMGETSAVAGISGTVEVRKEQVEEDSIIPRMQTEESAAKRRKTEEEKETEPVIDVVVEYTSLCSPDVVVGKNNQSSQEQTIILKSLIEGGHFVDLSGLKVKGEVKRDGRRFGVWKLKLDVYPLNDAGNVTDAVLMAAIGAIKSAKLPAFTIDKENKVVYDESKTTCIDVLSLPTPLTVGRFEKYYVPDCNKEEEGQLSSTTTVVMGDKQLILKLHRQGGDQVTLAEMKKMVAMSALRRDAILAAFKHH